MSALKDLRHPKVKHWLWCLHCQRFFPSCDLRYDDVGGREACAFEDCDGAGFDVDIFEWDHWANNNPDLKKRWPKDISELKKGMKCELYP